MLSIQGMMTINNDGEKRAAHPEAIFIGKEVFMITVIASIHVKPGHTAQFLDIFKSNVTAVFAEEGCIEYYPTVDVKTGLPPQELDENMVTIIEKWETPDALKNHLGSPHMLAYREQVKEIVEKLTVKVLKEA